MRSPIFTHCNTNEAPPIGAQSGSRIHQLSTFDAESKSKIPMFRRGGGGGVGGPNFQLLMFSPNLLKSKIPMLGGGGGGGDQFLTFDAESKFAKIQNSHVWGGGGQFPTFDAESKFAKIQNSHVWWGGRVGRNQFPTFDAESKFAKIQNSHVRWVGVGGGWWKLISNF